MENLTLAELNQLMLDCGYEIQFDTAEFEQINASNEAQYKVVYSGKNNHAFVYNLPDGTPQVSFNDYDEDTSIAPVDISNGGQARPPV